MTTNKMSTVRKPSVYMQLHFDDGSISAFECSVERFQDMRYNVARMLKVCLGHIAALPYSPAAVYHTRAHIQYC
jgi:hypothetical protein